MGTRPAAGRLRHRPQTLTQPLLIPLAARARPVPVETLEGCDHRLADRDYVGDLPTGGIDAGSRS